MTTKQQLKIKSSIIDANNPLNRIFLSFNSFYKELSHSFRIVDNFPNHFSFHLVSYKDKESSKAYLCKLNKIFEDALLPLPLLLIPVLKTMSSHQYCMFTQTWTLSLKQFIMLLILQQQRLVIGHLDNNNFYFPFLLFSDFILIFFFFSLLWMMKRYVTL